MQVVLKSPNDKLNFSLQQAGAPYYISDSRTVLQHRWSCRGPRSQYCSTGPPKQTRLRGECMTVMKPCQGMAGTDLPWS